MNAKEKLEAMRQRIKSRSEKGKKGKGSADVFPFWNMEIGQASKVRLLPDANEDNPDMFFVTKREHKLKIDGKTRTVICRQTFGEKCPICDLSQKYYKAGDKVKGKYYWRDITHIARVLILDTPLEPDEESGMETYVGQVMKTQIAYQLMQKIDEQLTSQEDPLEALPWDIHNGYDFIIKKTKQGEHANYQVGSTFARSPSAIPAKYADNIELVDLSTYLPEDPGFDEVQALLNQHLASSNGDDSDDEGDSEAPSGSTAERLAQRLMNRASSDEKKPEKEGEEEEEEKSVDADDELAAIKALIKRRNG